LALLAGESPAGGTCPVATVVIFGGGASDQSVGSPKVKALVGWVKTRSAPTGEQANRQVAAKVNRSEASKMDPPTRIGGWGSWKCRDRFPSGRRPASSVKELGISNRMNFPSVPEDDMSRKYANESTDPLVGRLGAEIGRTAKAARISRIAVKSSCACKWGAWDQISDDGPGQHNPDRSEGPWGKAAPAA
jgi:hypothetical protein